VGAAGTVGLMRTENSMIRPDLLSILDTAVASYARLVENDPGATAFPDLLAAVEEAGELARELGRRVTQAFVDARLAQVKATRRMCSCGRPMEWHKESEWAHGTAFGDVKVADIYAYCRRCHLSARPLHGWLGTSAERWSLGVEEKVVDLATDESCQRAVAKLARHHPGVEVGRTTALRMLHHHGAQAREFVAEKLAAALAGAAKEGRSAGVPELEVEYDGGMIPVATLEPIPVPEGQPPELTPVRGLPKRRKDCRWEEAKLGLLQVPGEVEQRLYTVRPTAELEEAFDDLLGLACMKGWSEQTQVRGIADGARHIRRRLAETFHACSFRFILDRPHAKEHLHDAGEVLEALGGPPKDSWATAALDRLEAGAALEVVAELRQAAERSGNETLRLEADYFERNQDAVAYQEYRDHGWSTASSEVESGHRSVVQVRLKLAGTWWHPDNVPNILALRMVKANGWWAEYWAHQRNRWREHAHELRSVEPRTRLVVATAAAVA
jgi:hypothetical protein